MDVAPRWCFAIELDRELRKLESDAGLMEVRWEMNLLISFDGLYVSETGVLVPLVELKGYTSRLLRLILIFGSRISYQERTETQG